MLDFTVVAGNGIVLDIAVKGFNGEKIDFTTDKYEVSEITFGVKDDVESDTFRITKQLGNGIELDEAQGIITITLDGIDTDIPDAVYVFDAIIEFTDGSSVSVRGDTYMTPGYMTVSPKITGVTT